MLNGHSKPTIYAEKLELFKQNDSARDVFIQDLIRDYEELKLKYDEIRNDYDNEVESRRMWQSKASLNERALAEQRQASVSVHVAIVRPLLRVATLVAPGPSRHRISTAYIQQGSNSFVLALIDGDGAIVSPQPSRLWSLA